jgi:hypothetical protein
MRDRKWRKAKRNRTVEEKEKGCMEKIIKKRRKWRRGSKWAKIKRDRRRK